MSLKLNPSDIFLIGGAGVEKSHLLKTTEMSINTLVIHQFWDPAQPSILLLEAKRVFAINADDTAIHSALGITAEGKSTPFND